MSTINRKTSTLMQKGLKPLTNGDVVNCWGVSTLPIGSKLFIIKNNKINLISPLIHIEQELQTDKYTYQRSKAILTCNNSIDFNCLVESKGLYYTLERSYKYTENGLYHYELKQCDISHLLIYDTVEDLPSDVLYDYTSLPYLLDLFKNKNNVECYPRDLLVNRELLMDKCLFIECMNSITPQASMSDSLGRIDNVKIYFNNYSLKDALQVLKLIQKLSEVNDLCLCSIGGNNAFNLQEIKQEGMVPSIGAFIEFDIFYRLTEENPLDVKKYIQHVIMTIDKNRQVETIKK